MLCMQYLKFKIPLDRLCLSIHVFHLTYHIYMKLNMRMNKKFARFNIGPFHSDSYLYDNKVKYFIAFINAFAPVSEFRCLLEHYSDGHI